MTKIRLSPTQIIVLLDLNREGNCLHYMGGMNRIGFSAIIWIGCGNRPYQRYDHNRQKAHD